VAKDVLAKLKAATGGAPNCPATPVVNRVWPPWERDILDPGWNVIHGGRVFKATSPTDPQPTPCPFTEALIRSEVTNIRITGKI